MADNASHSHSNENVVVSLANNSTVKTFNKEISPKVEDHYLRWPTSQERDFTQIITEDTVDTTTKTGKTYVNDDGRQETELKQCSEVNNISHVIDVN